MRLLALTLVFLIAALQWPLWAGKGGWVRVWELDHQLKAQQHKPGCLAVPTKIGRETNKGLPDGLSMP